MNITRKILVKVCAIIAIIALTLSDFLFIGTELVYAINIAKTNSSSVEFSAYFLDQNGEKVEKLEKNIDMEQEFLYVDISVKNEGYLSDGRIMLEGNNFNLKQDILSQDIASISGNEVVLNQINAGSTVTIKIGIEPINNTTITENMLDQKTKVELIGQYVNSKNVEKDKYIQIKGSTEVELAWKSSDKTKAELETSILTNSIYSVEEEQKRIVQILVNSKITNNNYPVKSSEISVVVPENATDVKVHARSTNSTNSSIEFSENNYEYNKGTNTVKVALENEDKNSISWNRNSIDSFVITCVFDKQENVMNKNITVDSKINTYDNRTLNASTNASISEEKDGIVSYSLETAESIYKGKIQIGEERDYEENTKINVDYLRLVDEISLKLNAPTFLAENNELQANITYKETKISRDEFLKIFGEDGFIIVKDDNGNVIANINKNTEKDDSGNFIINYFDGTKSIEFLTSKPVAVGTLNIVTNKTISNTEYSREQVRIFTGIKEKIEGSYNQKESVKTESIIELKNTETKADLNISVDKLSAVSKNENVKITAVLLNNDETKELFQNPSLEIKFPNQVTNIAAKCKLLYGNGLELADAKIENGNTIKVNMKGTQTSYNTETLEGTTLIIYANIDVNKLSTNSDEQITLNYTNEISKTNNKPITKPIQIVTNAGVILTNNIPELKQSSIGNEGVKDVVIENIGGEKNVSVNIEAINNEGTAIKDVTILGKFPTASTANMGVKLASGVNIASSTQNVKIYYSNNENANANLNDSSNGWTLDGDISTAKTYLIVIEKLNVSEIFNANYTLNIPANLGYNKEASLSYVLDYTNDLTGENKTVKATEFNLTTGTEAEIKPTLKAYVGGEEIAENSEVKAGEIIKYNLSLKNEGRISAENATLEVTIPDNTTLLEVNPKYPGYDEVIEEYTYEESYFVEKQDKKITKENINIASGESINLSYMVRVNSDLAQSVTAKTTANVKYKEVENKSEFLNTIIPNDLTATMEPYDRKSNQVLEPNFAYSYLLEIKNLKNIAQNNVEVTLNKNELIDIRSITCYIKSNSKEVDKEKQTFTIDSIPANESAYIKVMAFIKPNVENVTNAQISALIKNNGSTFRTNLLSEKVIGVEFNATQKVATSSNQDELNPGDSIKYEVQMQNVGKIDAEDLKIQDTYSNYLNIKSIKIDGVETEFSEVPVTEEKNMIDISLEKVCKSGEGINVEIIGTISEELNLSASTEIVNQLELYNDGSLVGQTDIAKNNLVNKALENEEVVENQEDVEKDSIDGENENGQNGQNEENLSSKEDKNETESKENAVEEQGSKISGIAWYDKNENGTRDAQEESLQGVKATLINLKDNTSKTIDTGADGKYLFTNVADGEYIVVFDYDTQKYMLTAYQVDSATSTTNSDVENVKLKINGEIVTKACTNTLKVSGTNIENIDIGLIDAKVFDLSLSKTISKVTISNTEGTQSLNYNDATLAKAEIRAKHLSGSTAVIEYKIKVTNNGEIAGYAKSIVDYKPTDLNFNSSLNKDWYQSGNNLYSTTFANTLINPGETKELTLILTKTMTESNTGLTNNIAEIAEVYNTLGVANKNGTPGNKDTKESDTGSANVIISVSTGTAVSYLVITLSIITFIATVSYFASKKILRENIKF